ncbi:MAG: FecR domain-containing protein [Pseudomonadota bacterium]
MRTELWLEALDLVEARESGSNQVHQAIESFCQRSDEHKEAFQSAERYQQAAKRLPRRLPTGSRHLKLQIQLWFARMGQMPVASALGLLVIGISLFILRPSTAPETKPVAETSDDYSNSYKTAWRQTRNYQLPDGSHLWLDWRSSVEVRFDDTTRTAVINSGRIAFDVATSPDLPFLVQARGVSVEVTGTEFVVQLEPNDRVTVNVLEGEVDVVAGDEQRSLSAEERLIVTQHQLGQVSPRSVDEMGRWREGMLVFKERPLIEALQELGGYLPYDIETRRLTNVRKKVTGVYFADEAEQGLKAILQSHQLEAQPQGDILVLRERPPIRP